MPIYMRMTRNGLPVINGDVRAKGHEKWIELTSAQLGMARIDPSAGTSGQKEAGKPVAQEVAITKMADSASRLLILAAMTNSMDELKVQIDFVKPDQKGDSTYMTWTLQEVIISSFRVSPSHGRQPMEQLTLNFTTITYNSIPSGVGTPPNAGWQPLHF